jgi:hypothetical protein
MQLSNTGRMTALAGDVGNLCLVCLFTIEAAVFSVFLNHATAHSMFTHILVVVVSHAVPPLMLFRWRTLNAKHSPPSRKRKWSVVSGQLIARSASWERGRPARNERFSAKDEAAIALNAT